MGKKQNRGRGSADQGELSKADFERAEEVLRAELLACQSRLMDEDFAVVVVLNGLESEPLNEVLNALFEWFDPRYLQPHALRERSEVEGREPLLRRYWKRIPPDGRIGVFLGGWILENYRELTRDRIGLDAFARNLGHMREMERQLSAAGTHIVKLWIGPAPHLEREDPTMLLLRETGWESSEWVLIETPHSRDRRLECGRAVAASVARRLDHGPPPRAVTMLDGPSDEQILARTDLSARLEREEYRRLRDPLKKRLAKLSARCAKRHVGSVCVFEGWDAAGKGGAIRRLTRAMDARNYKVTPIAAPSLEERRRPHLWRFWMTLPRAGSMGLYDRSWYGRVLVERVEGFASTEEWRRAYGEINDFEAQLTGKGFALCKFWLHIDPDEQLRRFRERERTPYKQYKITADDYRNREKWDAYAEAAEEMLARTSSPSAPWTVIAANDKLHARIAVLEAVCRALEQALEA